MKTTFYKKRPKNKGAVFMFVVMILTVTTVSIAIGFTQPNIREHRNSLRDNLSNNAFLFAEAGNEDAFYRLKQGMNVPGIITMSLNNSDATTTVTIVGATTRNIETVSAIDNHTRKSKLIIDNTTAQAEFLYGAQIGTWGVSMLNNSSVVGLAPAVGDIYSNGAVVGQGTGNTVTGNIYSSTGLGLDESASSTSCLSDEVVGKTDPEIDYAQSFIATSTTNILRKVELYLKKNNNPNSRTVYIVADNGGVPDTVPVTSGTLDRNKVTSTYSWTTITFDTAVTLTPGDTYWIVLDAVQHNSKYWYWCLDPTNPYAGGSSYSTEDWASPSWTSVTGDLTFVLYYGDGESVIDTIDNLEGDAHADTISDSIILGDAYYETIFGSTVLGTEYPDSPTPGQVAQPINDSHITNWVSVAELGGTISGDCPDTPGCSGNMGPIKIDGDLTATSTLTVSGTIYVTGNFFTDNNATVRCDPTYGTTSCIIVIDGYMDFRNGSDFQGSGTPGSFIVLISRKEGCLVDSGTDCGPLNSAIYHNNNASTGGIFFAQDSVAFLENNTSVSTVVAKGLKLSNNASVIYNVDLRDIELSAGSDGAWMVEDWREIE
jgi:hypothetical protein